MHGVLQIHSQPTCGPHPAVCSRTCLSSGAPLLPLDSPSIPVPLRSHPPISTPRSPSSYQPPSRASLPNTSKSSYSQWIPELSPPNPAQGYSFLPHLSSWLK